MSTSESAPSHTPASPSDYSRTEVISAVQDFYSLLIKLPYISPDALIFPPVEGWSGVNAEELRRRGKTEEVIGLLQQLPYLRAPAPFKRWMLGPDTIEIAYCAGELYHQVMEAIQPLPAHCIWLTEPHSRDGTGLILDTHAGTITEYTTMGHRIILDFEEYEKLPILDQWMAHPTLGAMAFFQLWKRKFERLIWMAVYDSQGREGTVQWYGTAETPQDEEDMLASDDGFDPNGDDHRYPEASEGESTGEDDMNDEDERISNEELEDLMEEAYGNEATRKRIDLQTQESVAEHISKDLTPSIPANQPLQDMSTLGYKTKAVYEIYTRSGWPSSFDRESCRMRLAEFIEREEGPVKQN